jgi:hypothetical protein
MGWVIGGRDVEQILQCRESVIAGNGNLGRMSGIVRACAGKHNR